MSTLPTRRCPHQPPPAAGAHLFFQRAVGSLLLIGSRLGHFRITAKLGEGGMGTVWAADDTRLRRRVALKLLSSERVGSQEERFRREAETLAALRHPNIVTIFAVEEDQGRSFLVMELVEGETLR